MSHHLDHPCRVALLAGLALSLSHARCQACMCPSLLTPWCYCAPSGVGVESSPCSPLQGSLAYRARPAHSLMHDVKHARVYRCLLPGATAHPRCMSAVVTLIRVYKERMVTLLTLLTYITVSGVGGWERKTLRPRYWPIPRSQLLSSQPALSPPLRLSSPVVAAVLKKRGPRFSSFFLH